LKIINFVTDAAAVAGAGAELNSGVQQVTFPYRIRILALKQPVGVVLADDADWQLWVNLAATGQIWNNESLDPINDGGVKLGPSGITIEKGSIIQFFWLNQAAAQLNQLSVYYEPI
jgi:hypothetical protein